MKVFWASLIFLAFAVNASADLTNKTLQIATDSTFSRCVADAAIAQVAAKMEQFPNYEFQGFIGTGVDGLGGPYPTATLDFTGASAVSSYLFTLRLTSADPVNQWKLVVGRAEIYPATASVSPTATLYDLDVSLGQVDISGCN